MKIKITNEEDTGQSVVVQYRETRSGSDGASVSVAPGQSAEVELNAENYVVVTGGQVHFTTDEEAAALVPAPPVVTGKAVTEAPNSDQKAPDGETKTADPDTVARITKEALDKGAATTADGKIQVSALNEALAEQGYGPVAADARDEAHAAATA